MTKYEYIIDVGAYNGDTLEKFHNLTQGEYNRIICLELNRFNYDKLIKKVDMIGNQKKVLALCVGAWSDSKEVTYTIGQSQSTLGKGTERGVVDKIDNIARDERITYIKMDIEGAEQEALKGAVQVIQVMKPKLAICVYHKFQDLWEIPFLIRSMHSDYKLYLRHHTPLEYETVCYALHD